MAQEKVVVQVACSSCGATGIYRGFAEPQGTGVKCLDCKGSGATTHTYTPYTGRQPREDIETVRESAGKLIVAEVGPTGDSMTYEEFLATVPAAEVLNTVS